MPRSWPGNCLNPTHSVDGIIRRAHQSPALDASATGYLPTSTFTAILRFAPSMFDKLGISGIVGALLSLVGVGIVGIREGQWQHAEIDEVLPVDAGEVLR